MVENLLSHSPSVKRSWVPGLRQFISHSLEYVLPAAHTGVPASQPHVDVSILTMQTPLLGTLRPVVTPVARLAQQPLLVCMSTHHYRLHSSCCEMARCYWAHIRGRDGCDGIVGLVLEWHHPNTLRSPGADVVHPRQLAQLLEPQD